MGANSHASLKWLSGNDRGNKANGACTNPTPGTFPDLYNVKKQQQQHQIHVLVFQLTTKHDYHWQYSIPFSYLLSFNIYWEYPSWKKLLQNQHFDNNYHCNPIWKDNIKEIPWKQKKKLNVCSGWSLGNRSTSTFSDPLAFLHLFTVKKKNHRIFQLIIILIQQMNFFKA